MSTTKTPDLPLPAADTDSIDLSRSIILIVDDNAQNVELLQAYLEALPCRTVTAADGLEAMKVIEAAVASGTDTPDLVLLDVMMPRMSGFEVCRKIKEDPATRSIPVMMVTALNELGDIERAVQAGTDDFLSKPVNKAELLKRVDNMLKLHHVTDEVERLRQYIERMESRS